MPRVMVQSGLLRATPALREFLCAPLLLLLAMPAWANPPDPSCWIGWSTLLGGAGSNERAHVAVAPDGNIVVSMATTDASWLSGLTGTVRTFGPGGGPIDIVVMRMSGDGTLVRWAAVIGGTGNDDGPGNSRALAVLPDNSIAMCGSASPGFPLVNSVEAGPTLPYKAFLLRMSADGDSLYFSTAIGGNNSVSEFYALDVDPAGRIFACGRTDANDFTGSPGAYQVAPGGNRDAFVCSFTWQGVLLRKTLLGGLGSDEFLSIALHLPADDVIVAGYSSTAGLGGAAPGYDPSMSGASDGTVARFDGNLTTLERFTYMGGEQGGGINGEVIYAVSTDTDGAPVSILLTASSTQLPVVPSWPMLRGSLDPYVFKLTPDWSGIEWATYAGGTFYDAGYALSRLPGGDWAVTGQSDSLDHPGTVPLLGARRGAYVIRLSPATATIRMIIGLGGNIGFASRLDGNGKLIIGGDVTAASVGTIPLSPPSLQITYAGGTSDGFVITLDPDAACSDRVPATVPSGLLIMAATLGLLATTVIVRNRRVAHRSL